MGDGERSTIELLAAALVAAFPRYVEEKLAEIEVAVEPEIAAAAEASCADLAFALHGLVATPVHLQQSSPLELVRGAMRTLSEALGAAGVTPPARDEQAVAINPDDVYDLGPASSQEFGEEVWQLHIEWGLEKARDVAGVVPAGGAGSTKLPAVAAFGVPRARRDGLAEAVADLGYELLVWRNPAALEDGLEKRPELVLVDVSHPNAHDAIRRAVSAGRRVVAVGNAVDDFAAAAVMALGAEGALELDGLVERLPGLLPRLV